MVAGGLGVVALIVFVVQMGGFFGGVSSSAAAPAFSRTAEPGPGRLPVSRSGGRAKASGQKDAATTLDPSLRLDLLKASEDTKYEGAGRNIFRVFVEIPKAITPPVQPQTTSTPAVYV